MLTEEIIEEPEDKSREIVHYDYDDYNYDDYYYSPLRRLGQSQDYYYYYADEYYPYLERQSQFSGLTNSGCLKICNYGSTDSNKRAPFLGHLLCSLSYEVGTIINF